MKASKNYRILCLYTWLSEGRCINLIRVANEFNVDVRTVQRDLADINAFLANGMVERGDFRLVKYDRQKRGYQIDVKKLEI